jgi:hypothetical protein
MLSAQPMRPSWKGIAFVAAAALAVFAALYPAHRESIDGYLHTGNLHAQDWMFWIFGPALVVAAARTLVIDTSAFDLRWAFAIILGGTMIYAEVFNSVPLKELTCNALTGTHHRIGSGPCYKAD